MPELRRAQEARAKLRHAILAVSLQKRLSKLKDAESDESDMGEAEPVPKITSELAVGSESKPGMLKEKLKGGAVFREVVLASVRDAKQKQDALKADEELEKEARRRSMQGS